jgi:hypothetical protein
VHRPGRRRLRELPDRVNNPKPNRHSGKIGGHCEFVSSLDAFRDSFVPIMDEHQVGDAPDVYLRYHTRKGSRRVSTYG